MNDVKLYYVGGYVRDLIIGADVKPKDIDYAVEAESFEAMKDWVLSQPDAVIFQEKPEFQTIVARIGKQASDYVWCRKDGPYSDGRRPDYTEPGTIFDDLARRDFTINAMALPVTSTDPMDGHLIDPHGGQRDIYDGVIRAVGEPLERMIEDPLRIMRALRFSVVKGFRIDRKLSGAMLTVSVLDRLRETTAADRMRDELTKMFKYDTRASMKILAAYPAILDVIADKGIWFRPTQEDK